MLNANFFLKFQKPTNISIHMKASEQLFAIRILTGVLSIILIALVVFIYNEYIPDLLVEAEQILAESMGDLDKTFASR